MVGLLVGTDSPSYGLRLSIVGGPTSVTTMVNGISMVSSAPANPIIAVPQKVPTLAGTLYAMSNVWFLRWPWSRSSSP